MQANNNLGLHDGYVHRLDPLDHTAVAKYDTPASEAAPLTAG